MARLHQGTVDVQRDSMAHHHVGELLGIGVPGGHISDITSLAQNSYPVGDIHYLVELVGDDDHGFAVGFHVAHDIKEPVGFLRSEDSGGLVQNQNVCAPVEYFDDFHRLLFGDRHVINFFVGVDDEAILLADFRNPGGCGFEIQLAGLFQAQHNIFRCGKDIHQFEVLMDHADAAVKGVFGRCDGDGISADQNLSFIGEINSGQHVHQGGFTAAVFTQQGQNLTPFDVQRDIVVGNDFAEALGDVFHLDGISVFQANLPFF